MQTLGEVVVMAHKLLLKNSYGSGKDHGYSLNQTKSHTTSCVKEKQTNWFTNQRFKGIILIWSVQNAVLF